MAKFYQVGGSVRDLLMGAQSKDIDYAVEAESLTAMREAILARGGTIYLETPEFFTIRGSIPELGPCDFVLCRKEGNYIDGRHPGLVESGTIIDDLARRDFTMNAIAIGPEGEVLDPHEGKADIQNKRIRCVGDTWTRFTEDGLRMLRAVRFSITKNFYLSGDIDDLLADEEFFEPRLKGVSTERIREELMKCFSFDTNLTLDKFGDYPRFRRFVLSMPGLWLKPTLEKR